MRGSCAKAIALLLVASFLPLQFGCTKEKAEALKTAAKDFRTQADVAIDKMEDLFAGDVAFAPLSQEQERQLIIDSLQPGAAKLGRAGIEGIINDSRLPDVDTSEYSKKLNQIRSTYEEFEAMFDDLPRGHYFAGDAVERSEHLAKKLVAQMVFLAKYIRDNPFRLNARIQLAVRAREEAIAETDPVKKASKFTGLATEIQAIRAETKAANEAAILECLKGAEIGLKVVDLTKNYKRMNVNDILSVVRDGLSRVNQLTGKNVEGVNKRVDEIAGIIAADSDWSAILNRVTTEMG